MRDSTSLPLPPRGPPQNAREAQILYDRIRSIALWLDSIPINGKTLPFGLEAIIGLIPMIGDIIGLVLGLYQIYLISFFDVPSTLLLKMFINVVIDCFIGIIPYLGDILDVFYKANIYNINMLEDWLKKEYGNNIVIYKE